MLNLSKRDWWPIGLFAVHLTQAFLFAGWYPESLYDPDLLAYFGYFRGWVEHDAALQGCTYFIPKPLLVFILGPLGNVRWAFACSAVASALLGSLAYLIGRDCFGRMAGVLFSAFLLLDPTKTVLTLNSSADLYVGLFLLWAVYLSTVKHPARASACLLLSALVKPVTLPCALHVLTTDTRGTKRWIWLLVPMLAIPLTLLSNQALLGSALGSDKSLMQFATLRDGSAIQPGEVLHFALWRQLVRSRFVSTAPWGFLGVLLWVARDRRRLTSPVLLIPILFLSGYVGLSLVSPYMPFFRFFWPVEVWFLGFLIFGMLEAARQLAGGRAWVRAAVSCLLLFFLADDSLARQLRYRDHFALPFERSMAFVSSSREALRNESAPGEHVLTPMTFLPYLAWELPADGHGKLIAAEQAALDGSTARPEWILDVPDIYLSQAARDLVARLVRQGQYEVRLTDGTAALLRRAASRSQPPGSMPGPASSQL